MSLWKIALRSIWQRGLASSLTALSMALGVAMVVAVLVILGVVDDSFRKNAGGYDILVGPNQGSGLDLVLNTVYHLGTPKANLPYSYYKEFIRSSDYGGRYASSVAVAIPYCLGDSYEGYRVVATTPEMFDVPYAQGQSYEFASGRNFKSDSYFEGVVGSLVSSHTGLKVGDEFEPTHGVSDSEIGHKHDAFKVVGVLAPTGTPNDRALFINMEGFYLLEGHALEEAASPQPSTAEHAHDDHDHEAHSHDAHDHEAADHDHEGHDHADETPAPVDTAGDASQAATAATPHEHEHEHAADAHDHDHADHDHANHHEPLPESQREVTAILVRTANPLASLGMMKSINRDTVAQAVQPVREIYNLSERIIGNLRVLLLFLAVLIVVVAGIGIMVSIYNSMSERRREIALMRSLGAGRSTVLWVVLLESVLLSLGGGILGVVLGHALIGCISPLIVAQTGVEIGFLRFVPYELTLIPGLVVLAALVGFLPAMSAYRTDVAKALSAN